MILEITGIIAAICMLLVMPLDVYLAHTKLEIAESYFEKSIFINDTKNMLRNQHFKGAPVRLMAIAAVLLMPQMFYWRKLVLPEEVKSVPGNLKLWMVAPLLFTLFTLAILVIAWLGRAYEL